MDIQTIQELLKIGGSYGGGGVSLIILLYILNSKGIITVKRSNNNGNSPSRTLAVPCGLHDNVIKKMDERDEKYKQILSENHTTQQLIMQRMDQTDKGLEQGRSHFARLFENQQQHDLEIKLIDQRVGRIEK